MRKLKVTTITAEGSVTVEEEMSPEMEEAWDAFDKRAKQIRWCKCSDDVAQPYYWELPNGTHGWDCAVCGGLTQIG